MIIPGYTSFSILVFLACALAVAFQAVYNKHTKAFLVSLSVAIAMLLGSDNFAAMQGLWNYDPEFLSQWMIPFVPAEKILVGIAFFLATIFFFEHLSSRLGGKENKKTEKQ